ncbi:MAG: S-layer homology domain-containing protein [Candidatus Metalachnospira sp.]|nr:S-layer homology domain-containing protein [Candidatus Metalachnospira sp.]
MKSLKRFAAVSTAIAMLTSIMPTAFTVFASDSTKIKLSDSQILVDGQKASTDSTSAVYTGADIAYYHAGTDSSYGEGTESDMHTVQEAAENTVVTITKPGTYVVSGELSKGQIAVDLGEDAAEDKDAVVTLILNGVDITCTVAPAVIFYNVYECGTKDTATASSTADTANAGARVIIADGTTNNISGSHVAKVYKEGTTKKLHKYDGAFYSCMSMVIDGGTKGTGKLNITADNEGLDSELHLTINGGIIHINSGDDGINTNEDGVSVTTINGGYLYIFAGNGTEGDGIDSNGWIQINGGTVISLANPKSMDGGIDSDMGTYINGGTVVGAGGMYDEIDASSKQLFMFMQFSEDTDDTIVITDENDKPVFAYDFPYDYSYIVLSTPKLEEGTYHVYSGGSVDGTVEDGLYTSITSYTDGTQMHQGGTSSAQVGGMFGGEHPKMPSDGNTDQRRDGEGMPEMPADGTMPQRPADGTAPEGNANSSGPKGMKSSSDTVSYDFVLTKDSKSFTNVTSQDIKNITETSDINRPAGQGRFRDVKQNSWYASAVDYVYTNGIMSGISTSAFEPETGVTRAMSVQILYKLSGAEKVETSSGFTDVKSGEWYTDALNWAASKGIAGGYNDGSFKPDQLVTREELSAFLYRYAGSPEDAGMALREYEDGANISDYAKMSMLWCVHNGLISGMGDGTLAPKNTALRGQLASIAMRYMELNK